MLPDPRLYFAELNDPRRETRNKLHKLSDILMIVLCAVLSGIEDWVGMEEFATQKESWFRGFLELPNGIPSHDTISDVMGRIERKAFADAFMRWVQVALPSLSGEQICLDGKTLRGSREGDKAVHLVSAYAAKARLVLAQQAVANKSNEINAIPDVLSMLEWEGAVVTIDAMGCQKNIARQIAEAGGDYVLALKDKHPTLCEDVRLWLETETTKAALPVHETVEKDHGRIEIRRYSLSGNIDWLEQKQEWAGLVAVGRVESTRTCGGKTSTECRYYLCSFNDLLRFAGITRGHWGIENGQHWVLDVQFGEDANRARKDHSAENLALIRRM
ncbi:ISAs1 family transposase [Candidatus Methylospira mobilis]|uniref:ISAs1 family transposase n=1 Tax=Candidatus Methylospira mobilis TaxID=1808979 RepID=A0A5Q0BQZ5_9GAMM|nr:ISAs1 family transposase [Candidatus Methylospira mobilis]QFY44721.1 ISAs1 family transposase [Candidatus Methylospira mobilis]